MSALSAAVLVALALGDEPQCPPTLASCFFDFADGHFGDIPLSLEYGYSTNSDQRDAMCNNTNWLYRDACFNNCPLSLELTAPEEVRGVKFCLQDNSFTPYERASHLDLTHPLNGKEMALEVVGKADDVSRSGCRFDDFAGKNFTDKIAVISRGGCSFYKKFDGAFAAGAKVGLMANNHLQNDIRRQMFSMIGTSGGHIGMPALNMPTVYSEVLIDMLDRGVDVRGKVALSCAKVALEVDPDEAVTDSCPHANLIRTRQQTKTCYFADEEENRLCQKCPTTWQFDPVDDNNISTCLWGNDLLPRKKENSFAYTEAYPKSWAETDMFWVEEFMWNEGCVAYDWVGVEGMVMAVPQPSACLPYRLARLASAAGVKGLIFYERRPGYAPVLVAGHSAFVDMPVHALSGDDTFRMYYTMRIMVGVRLLPSGAIGREVPSTKFTDVPLEPRPVDTTPPPTPPPVVANAAVPESLPEFEFTVSVIVSIIAIAVFSVLLVLLYLRQRLTAVSIPKSDNAKEGFSVPLGVASMSLSLSLLVIIAVVAFTLAYVAGQDARNTAEANGKAAKDITYENAVSNVADVADKLQGSIGTSVKQGILSALEQGETATLNTANMFLSYDGYSWSTFANNLPQFYDYANSIDSRESITVRALTLRSYFVSHDLQTDSRADADRRDGVVGSVAETNNGDLYGEIRMRYENLQAKYFATSFAVDETNRLSGGFGSPHRLTLTKTRGDLLWYTTSRSFPLGYKGSNLLLSCFTPMFNRQNRYVGTAEAQFTLQTFSDIIENAVTSEGLENVTVTIYDVGTKAIIGTTGYMRVNKLRGRVIVSAGTYDDLEELYTFYDIPAPTLHASGRYLDNQTDGWTQHSGMYNEREWFAQQPLTVVRVRAGEAAAEDVSGDQSDVEMRGGSCGACLGDDPVQAGRRVLRFNGDNVLHIYRNLTVDSPRVQKYVDPSANGTYKSLLEEYSETMLMEPGVSDRECVAYTPLRSTEVPNPVTNCLQKDDWLARSFSFSVAINPDESIGNNGTGNPDARLFTDVDVGEVNFRLFANGRLTLAVFDYGCNVEPYAPGIPGGQWTTLTGVVDMRLRVCITYVNGTFYRFGRFADSHFGNDQGKPLFAGQEFKGYMDNITVWNQSLYTYGSRTPASIQETGDFVQVARDQDLYVDVTVLSLDSDTRSGIYWGVQTLLPRDDIMREVDYNNAVLDRNLKIQEENTQKRLNQRSNEAIMIVVAIALFSVFVFLYFNDVLTRPFTQSAVLMADAAIMKIDVIPESESVIRELNAMNRAMALMLMNLKEYKSYMPQSLQLDSEMEADDDEERRTIISEGEEGITLGRVTSGASSTGRSASGSSIGSVLKRIQDERSSCARTVVAANAARAGLMLTLTRKRMTFVVCNVKGWLTEISRVPDADVVHLHAGILTLTLQVFQTYKGVSEAFSGDRFVASFNAVKNAGTHRVMGCLSAMQIRDEMKRKTQIPLRMHCAVAAGDGRVGNCGNDVMKKFTFMTPVYTWVHALERVANSMDIPILADNFVFDDIAGSSVVVKLVNEVVFPKRLMSKAIRIAEVISRSGATATDEWMYELEEAAKACPAAKWNKFAVFVLTGQFDEAETVSAEAKAYDSGNVYNELRSMIEQKKVLAIEMKYH